MRRLCAVILLIGTVVPWSAGLAAQISAADQPSAAQGQQTPPPTRPSQTPPPPPDQAGQPPRAPFCPAPTRQISNWT